MTLWDLISGGLQAGGNIWAANDDIDRVTGLGEDAYNRAAQTGQTVLSNTEFQPFTVTSSLGSGSFNPMNGSVNYSLGGQLGNAVSDTLGLSAQLANRFTNPMFAENRVSQFGETMGVNQNQPGVDSRFSALTSGLGQQFAPANAQSLMSSLGIDRVGDYTPMSFNDRVGGVDFGGMFNTINPGRVTDSGMDRGAQILSQMGNVGGRNEEEIFNMLEGMQEPGRERARLDLENRLFSQGRTGVRTDAYGGTPEQLAMEKAIQESRSGNAFNAYQLAADEAFKNRSARANEVTSAYGLGLQERGQDITQNDILGRLGLGALNAGLTQRGQDISQNEMLGQLNLGALDRALTQRGQDISQNSMFGQLGLGAMDRALQERGQNLNQYLAEKGISLDAFNSALAERQQNISQQDIFANQALNAYRTALSEQGLLGDQMAQLAQTAFLPQQMLLQEMGLGLDAAEIAQRSALGGNELFANLITGGLDSLFNAESVAAGLTSNRNRDLANLLLGSQQSGQDGLLSSLADLFGWSN